MNLTDSRVLRELLFWAFAGILLVVFAAYGVFTIATDAQQQNIEAEETFNGFNTFEAEKP
jgi:uncharacterized membrane protein YjfL (UPF0719 family)